MNLVIYHESICYGKIVQKTYSQLRVTYCFFRYGLAEYLQILRLNCSTDLKDITFLNYRNTNNHRFHPLPFFVPENATTWVRKPGVTADFLTRLKQWRRKLFVGVGSSMALLSLAVFSLVAALPSAIFWDWAGINYSLILAAVSWLGSITLMQFWLPRIFNARPQVSENADE